MKLVWLGRKVHTPHQGLKRGLGTQVIETGIDLH
jgi:hypothetical protein